MPPLSTSPTVLLETAQTAAATAGAYLRDVWQKPRHIQSKGWRDLVTDADVEAQRLITELIRGRFPDHAFLTEEDDPSLPTTGTVKWIVDPIDGTSNFSRQVPIFSISIAAVAPEGILAGVVYDPLRDEMFCAAANQPTTFNHQPVHASQVNELIQAIIAFDWSRNPADRQLTLDLLNRLAHQVHTIRAVGSAALGMAWVACGRLDAYFNAHMKPWDAAAGVLLVQQAGGHLSTLQNQPWLLNAPIQPCLVSNGIIHESLLGQSSRSPEQALRS